MPQSRRLSPRLAANALRALVLSLALPASLLAQEPVVLYDQPGPPSGNGIPDQNFEAGMDEFDSQAADDFEVTGEYGWDVSRLRTVGTSDESFANKVAVRIYANSPGGGNTDLPGAVVCSYDQLTTTTFPSLDLALPTPCHLPPGRYWLGVQVDQSYEEHGQHFWSNTRVQHGSEGVWMNALDGFERECRTFKPQTGCLVGGANNPDLIFQILGRETPPPTTDLVLELAAELPPSSIFVRYELKLTNHGPLDASGVLVTKHLPEGCVFERDSCGGSYGEGWEWHLGQLASGSAAECQVVCDVADLPPGQRLVATATVVADQLVTNAATTTDQVEVITGFIPAVPTAGTIGLGLLAALLAAAGAFLLRRP